MRIKASIKISGTKSDLVAVALISDNTNNMNTEIKANSAITYFETHKIGTLIASVDDYLMNAKVAQDMVLAADEESEARRFKKRE